MTKTQATYRIEIRDRDTGRWELAPGEATGWTKREALRAVRGGLDFGFGPNEGRVVAERKASETQVSGQAQVFGSARVRR